MTSANQEIFEVAKPQSPGAVLMYPARRVARRLLRPWLAAIAQRLDDLDAAIAAVSAEVKGTGKPNGRAHLDSAPSRGRRASGRYG